MSGLCGSIEEVVLNLRIIIIITKRHLRVVNFVIIVVVLVFVLFVVAVVVVRVLIVLLREVILVIQTTVSGVS